MAAKRLGFERLYEAANDDAPDSISKPFLEGDLWALRPLRDVLLPIVAARAAGRDHELIALLRGNSPLLTRRPVAATDVAKLLRDLKRDVDQLVKYVAPGSSATVGEVLGFAAASGLVDLDERLLVALPPREVAVEDVDDVAEATLARILACPAVEAACYGSYIEGASPYATHHGVKGAEFEKVIVVVDDDEGRGFTQYSYDKLFGLKTLSKKDTEHVNAGEESILDRTRRLFYVCCSRAREDLAVAYFTQDAEFAAGVIRESGFFRPEQVIVVDAY